VNHGKINATLPKGTDPESITLEEALAMLAAKGDAGGSKAPRKKAAPKKAAAKTGAKKTAAKKVTTAKSRKAAS
jgi:DNA topoisomerase-1